MRREVTSNHSLRFRSYQSPNHSDQISFSISPIDFAIAAEKPFKSMLKSLEKLDGGEFRKYYSLPALNDPRISYRTLLRSFLSLQSITAMSFRTYKSQFKLLNDGTIRCWREGKRHNAHMKRWPRSSKAKFECVFSEVGVVKEDGFSKPVNPSSQETLGHCFIEFNSPQSSRYPGSPSLLSPVIEEDEEPVHSDETSADDHDDIMQWSEQEMDDDVEEEYHGHGA